MTVNVHRAPLAGVGLSLLLLAVAGEPAGAGKAASAWQRFGYAPDADREGAAPLEADAWVVETPDYSARLVWLDDVARRAFLREHAGATVDPFGAAGPDSAGFVTFRLDLESRSEGPMVFQPQNCRLVTNEKIALYPMDLPTIESAYGLLDREVPPTYRAARPALYDGERILRYGVKESGLLVYRTPDPTRTKSFVVEVRLMTPAGSVVEFTAPYRRYKKRKEP